MRFQYLIGHPAYQPDGVNASASYLSAVSATAELIRRGVPGAWAVNAVRLAEEGNLATVSVPGGVIEITTRIVD